jgi:hypothetical protein
MTITYPRDFPDADPAAQRCKFDYATFGEMSRTAAGAITFQERMGGSLWELSLTTRPLNETDYSRWHAWYLSLRGGQQSFKGRDLRRCWPLAYGKHALDLTVAGSGLPFDGSCQVTAVAGNTIALGGLPANYQVSVGDYISFDWLGGRALVKALEPMTGSGAGNVAAFTVGPWQRTGGTVPASATVVRAWCLMRPKPGSWSGERTVRDPISFDAIQTLV